MKDKSKGGRRLERVFGKVSHRMLKEFLKSEGPSNVQLNVRVPATVREDIVETAGELGLSVSRYLTKLHELAKPKLRIEGDGE